MSAKGGQVAAGRKRSGTLYFDLTIRHSSCKCGFESPLSFSRVEADFIGSTAKKWRPATRLHTKNNFTAEVCLLRLRLRNQDHILQLSRAFLSAHGFVQIFYFPLFLLVPPSPEPPEVRVRDRKMATGGQVPLSILTSLTPGGRGGRRKAVGVWRRQGPPLNPKWTARCQSCLHVTQPENALYDKR